jgi:hypothetical protein
MKFVLLSVDIILQEDLNLLIILGVISSKNRQAIMPVPPNAMDTNATVLIPTMYKFT